MKKITVDKEKIANSSKGLIDEFKEFISRGNVMDLAVGVIIGSAFSNIVTSFTSILTDLIGTILGGINFKGLSYTIGELTVNYGEFLQAIFDFLVTALCIFVLVKLVNKVINNKKKEKEENKEPAPVTKEQELLEEIRDLLKENNKMTKKTKK